MYYIFSAHRVSQCLCVCARLLWLFWSHSTLRRAKNCSAHCCVYLWSHRQMRVTFTCFHLSTSKQQRTKRTRTHFTNKSEQTACTISVFCFKTIIFVYMQTHRHTHIYALMQCMMINDCFNVVLSSLASLPRIIKSHFYFLINFFCCCCTNF